MAIASRVKAIAIRLEAIASRNDLKPNFVDFPHKFLPLCNQASEYNEIAATL